MPMKSYHLKHAMGLRLPPFCFTKNMAGVYKMASETSKEFVFGIPTVYLWELGHFCLVTVTFVTDAVGAVVALAVGDWLRRLRFAFGHFVDALR